jgi:hypothetical protein
MFLQTLGSFKSAKNCLGPQMANPQITNPQIAKKIFGQQIGTSQSSTLAEDPQILQIN